MWSPLQKGAVSNLVKELKTFYSRVHFSWSIYPSLGVSSILEDLDYLCNLYFVKVLHRLLIEMLNKAKWKTNEISVSMLPLFAPVVYLINNKAAGTDCRPALLILTRSISWKLQVNIMCKLLFYLLTHIAARQEKKKVCYFCILYYIKLSCFVFVLVFML